MNRPFAIGILGAGFSGKMLASRLLSSTVPLKIYLIDPSFVNGIAYGTNDPAHLLNVRSGNMGALAGHPGHLVEYLNDRFGETDWDSKFASRQVYSNYLDSIFNKAKEASSNVIELIDSEVTSVSKNALGKIEVVSSRKTLELDHLVLAYGNIHSSKIPTAAGPVTAKAAWPIENETLSKSSLLFVGASLTMIDLALSAARLNPDSKLFAVSRNGLMPAPHTTLNPDGILTVRKLIAERFQDQPVKLLELLSYIRKLAKKYPWREVVDALRPLTVPYWKQFTLKEKKIFNRRLSTFWSIHRHRAAPEVIKQLEDLISRKQLTIIRGSILSTKAIDSGLEVTIRKRNGREVILKVDEAINCTGPAPIRQLASEPLFKSLIDAGLITIDELGVGLSMKQSEDSQILFTKQISSLGPPLRGELLECTAIPELREYAERLSTLLQSQASN